MPNARSDFYFRNRRWLLLALALVVWTLVPIFRLSTGQRVVSFLSRLDGGVNRELWTHALYVLAAAWIGLGALWRTWGSAYLGANVVQDKQLHSERLVADGPFRQSRNPLYFGNMLIAIGFAIVINPVAGAVLVIGMWGLVRLFIRDEEAGFERSQSDAYRAYRSALPRLVPSRWARIPSAGTRPRWVQGFCGEALLWMFCVLTAGFALTLNSQWYETGLVWGILIVLPLTLWAKRSSRRAGFRAV